MYPRIQSKVEEGRGWMGFLERNSSKNRKSGRLGKIEKAVEEKPI
jgi:hypothetical protein